MPRNLIRGAAANTIVGAGDAALRTSLPRRPTSWNLFVTACR
eukprot:CAMPEP_0181102226 /NCGR_PEP_ID=MMETSP1071-20121207/14198_1 /TAXON_ID=35127 /ORGANISM="Thalassiosira sp., Strain NH16" /LENGTH=41 /DNA_ID= /DNA_START= /DNA_END= /DNA_ORIENTATION=